MSEMPPKDNNSTLLMCPAGLGEMGTMEERQPEVCQAHLEMVKQTTMVATKMELFAKGFGQIEGTLAKLENLWFKEVTNRMPRGTVLLITSLVGILTAVIGAVIMYALTHGGKGP